MNPFAQIRKRLDVTQSAMAEALGVTQANVSFYEVRNQTVPPDVARRLIHFAKSKGVVVSFDDIYSVAVEQADQRP